MLCAAQGMAEDADSEAARQRAEDVLVLQNCLAAYPSYHEDSRWDLLGVGALACVNHIFFPCRHAAESGIVMHNEYRCYSREAAAWDIVMEEELTAALAVAAAQDRRNQSVLSAPEFEARLRESQSHWVTHREASCEMRIEYWGRGSLRVSDGARCWAEMTAMRASVLGHIARSR